jgi:hypothetical protein
VELGKQSQTEKANLTQELSYFEIDSLLKLIAGNYRAENKGVEEHFEIKKDGNVLFAILTQMGRLDIFKISDIFINRKQNTVIALLTGDKNRMIIFKDVLIFHSSTTKELSTFKSPKTEIIDY